MSVNINSIPPIIQAQNLEPFSTSLPLSLLISNSSANPSIYIQNPAAFYYHHFYYYHPLPNRSPNMPSWFLYMIAKSCFNKPFAWIYPTLGSISYPATSIILQLFSTGYIIWYYRMTRHDACLVALQPCHDDHYGHHVCEYDVSPASQGPGLTKLYHDMWHLELPSYSWQGGETLWFIEEKNKMHMVLYDIKCTIDLTNP